MEGSYTAKAGFQWLQQMRGGNNHTNGWSKIWKLKCPEKIKFLLWTEWHESNPTLQLLHHRGVTSSNICMRCSLCEETFVYVVRDCPVSRDLSKALGFRDHTFFAEDNSRTWLCIGTDSSSPFLFLAGVWGAWQVRDLHCLAQTDTCLHQLVRETQHLAATMEVCFGGT